MTKPSPNQGVMPLARLIGEKLERDPIPPLEAIAGNVFRPTRRDLWPADVWSEMDAIWKGEKP